MFLDRSEHIRKEKIKDEHFDVARTRKCAKYGSDEEKRWLTFQPSLNLLINISIICIRIISITCVFQMKIQVYLNKSQNVDIPAVLSQPFLLHVRLLLLAQLVERSVRFSGELWRKLFRFQLLLDSIGRWLDSLFKLPKGNLKISICSLQLSQVFSRSMSRVIQSTSLFPLPVSILIGLSSKFHYLY